MNSGRTWADQVNERSLAVGVDIGGTKIGVILLTPDREVVGREILPTEAHLGFGRAVERLCACIEGLLSRASTGKLDGIGIGCAGPLDSASGLINNPYTLTGWDQCDIVSPLRERFEVPVYLENDADVAAVGECAAGSGLGFDPVVMLTFGTGIGGASVIGGHIHRGVKGEHPELGHIVVSDEGPACYCGARGCLESLASGTAISTAGGLVGLESARAVFAAAATGSAEAQEIVGRATRAGAAAAWTICHTLLPQRLVLGGGIMDDHFDLFASAMRERLRPATQLTPTAVSIAPAALGNDAGIIGAASLVFQRLPQN